MVSAIKTDGLQESQFEATDGLTSGEDGILLCYEVLLEEVERTVEEYNEVAVGSLRSNDYESVRQLMEWSEQVTAHHSRIAALQKEWAQILATWESEASMKRLPGPSVTRGRPEGLRTPGRAFRLPILQCLAERGGFAVNVAILSDVYGRLKPFLNEDDHQPLLANPEQPRWRNTGLWCLAQMAVEGLVVSGSSRGSWQTTDEGKAELARLQGEAGVNGHDTNSEELPDWELASDTDDEGGFEEGAFETEDPEEEPVKGR